MIEWCNANSGFVMTILTLIYVVATIIVVALMLRANRLTARSMQIAVQLDKERSKPVVIMEVVPDIPFFRLKVRNIGLTAAHRIKFAVTPEPKLCFGGKDQIPIEKKERTIQFVSEGIQSLPPQGEVSTTLGTLERIEESLDSLHFCGKITYTDLLGDSHETIVDFDLSIFKDLVYTGKKTIDTVARELEKIRQELDHIGSGVHKPHVRTQDIADFKMEEQERRVAVRKAFEELKNQKAEQTPGGDSKRRSDAPPRTSQE